MLSVYLFVLALVFTFGTVAYKKEWNLPKFAEIFLGYVLFINVGVMGFLAAYAHVFMGPQTALLIGWKPGSPFQFEMGMANLSYGVLGILSICIRGRFWDAVAIGWSVLLLGCFVGHLISYYIFHNTAPYNIGVFLWFNDLFLPLLVLATLIYLRFRTKIVEAR